MKQFYKKYAYSAIVACKGTGLFPSVMLAQAALESGYNTSVLSSKYNNFFGIKANNYTGRTVNLSTGEVINGKKETINSNFRVYKSATESFTDRNKFLKTNARYKSVFTAKTPEEQCNELQKAGYATAQNYANTLIKIINENNLKTIDKRMIMNVKIDIVLAILFFCIALLNIAKITGYLK